MTDTGHEFRRHRRQGTRLTYEAAEALRSRLANSPEDTEARTQLLGYLEQRSREAPDVAEQTLPEFLEHARWFLRNHPEDRASEIISYLAFTPPYKSALCAETETLWLEYAHNSQDARVLCNAASFLKIYLPAEALKAAQRAVELAPDDARSQALAGDVYALQACRESGTVAQEMRSKAMHHYSRALQLPLDPRRRPTVLCELGRLYLRAGDLESARSMALQLLEEAKNANLHWEAHFRHDAYTLLGRVALRSGYVEGAVGYLLDSARVQSAPVSMCGDLSMALAAELLEQDQRDAVRQFLELCPHPSSSKPSHAKLQEWRDALDRGETPDFGPYACP